MKRVRIRKNALMLFLIASFLVTMPVIPSHANGTTLAIDPVETVQPSGTFFIDITVDDVAHMWGYQLWVFYDTSVLTAIDFVSVLPFTEPQGTPLGGEINDAEGYVAIFYSYPMGELEGLTTTVPVGIAFIEFSVDAAPGGSPLAMKGVIISDPDGNEIGPITTVNGWFRTVAGWPVSWFEYTPGGDPFVGETVTFTSLSNDDGTIVKCSWDFGDGTSGTGAMVTHTYAAPAEYPVTLTVTDNSENMDSHARKVIISLEPIEYGPVDLRNSHAAFRRFSIAERDPETINTFTAWVKNLSPDQPTLVKVMWSITCEGVHLGELTVNATIAPKVLAQFTADFDVLDPTWEYDPEEPARKDYIVSVSAWYADLLINGEPHFTEGSVSGAHTDWFRVTTLP